MKCTMCGRKFPRDQLIGTDGGGYACAECFGEACLQLAQMAFEFGRVFGRMFDRTLPYIKGITGRSWWWEMA